MQVMHIIVINKPNYIQLECTPMRICLSVLGEKGKNHQNPAISQ